MAGFVAMVFNLFFINLVIAGLHSYAGWADVEAEACARTRRTSFVSLRHDRG